MHFYKKLNTLLLFTTFVLLLASCKKEKVPENKYESLGEARVGNKKILFTSSGGNRSSSLNQLYISDLESKINFQIFINKFEVGAFGYPALNNDLAINSISNISFSGQNILKTIKAGSVLNITKLVEDKDDNYNILKTHLWGNFVFKIEPDSFYKNDSIVYGSFNNLTF